MFDGCLETLEIVPVVREAADDRDGCIEREAESRAKPEGRSCKRADVVVDHMFELVIVEVENRLRKGRDLRASDPPSVDRVLHVTRRFDPEMRADQIHRARRRKAGVFVGQREGDRTSADRNALLRRRTGSRTRLAVSATPFSPTP